jgi:hypothetical protein
MKIEPNRKSKLALALKRRFGSPAAVLRALGLDENLVDNRDVDGSKARVADFKVKLQQWLHEQRNSLPEQDGGGVIGRILAVLDQDVGGEDEVDGLAQFKAFFRSKGLSDADIEEALRLAEGGESAADRLPVPATKGGFGGHGNGVKVAADERKVAQAEAGLEEMFGTRRIGIGLDYGGLRRPRPVSTPTPNARQIADFNVRFPDAARIEG